MTEKKLTKKQSNFCKEYIYDWHITNATIRAGYSKKTAYSIGSELLKKPEIKANIKYLQDDLQKVQNISQSMIINELKALAFNSIENTHETWFTLKEFEDLSSDVKKAIKEVKREIKTMGSGKDKYTTEMIQIKKYDKTKAIEILNKMLGYNIDRLDITSKGEKIDTKFEVEIVDGRKKDESQ